MVAKELSVLSVYSMRIFASFLEMRTQGQRIYLDAHYQRSILLLTNLMQLYGKVEASTSQHHKQLFHYQEHQLIIFLNYNLIKAYYILMACFAPAYDSQPHFLEVKFRHANDLHSLLLELCSMKIHYKFYFLGYLSNKERSYLQRIFYKGMTMVITK